jgi:hypothetical protein
VRDDARIKVFTRKSEGNRQLARPRRRWKDNIKLQLTKIGEKWTGLIWLKTGSRWKFL